MPRVIRLSVPRRFSPGANFSGNFELRRVLGLQLGGSFDIGCQLRLRSGFRKCQLQDRAIVGRLAAMRTLPLALLFSSLLVFGCSKTTKDGNGRGASASSSDDDDKGSSGKKKKSGGGDDDGGACATKYVDEAKDHQGNEFSFTCPADCEPAPVWGVGWYTADSSICSAAVHSGAIKASKGGKVTIKAKKGLKRYKGTKANGVTSSEWEAFDTSFSVNDSADGNGTPKKGEAEKITCSDTVEGLNHTDDDKFEVVCPPGCKSAGTVWGSGPYTTDSSICRAAIHAGVVTDDDGGTVKVTVSEGEKKYSGTKKNGVKTEDYGDYAHSMNLK
jgi:hypothetical protein